MTLKVTTLFNQKNNVRTLSPKMQARKLPKGIFGMKLENSIAETHRCPRGRCSAKAYEPANCRNIIHANQGRVGSFRSTKKAIALLVVLWVCGAILTSVQISTNSSFGPVFARAVVPTPCAPGYTSPLPATIIFDSTHLESYMVRYAGCRYDGGMELGANALAGGPLTPLTGATIVFDNVTINALKVQTTLRLGQGSSLTLRNLQLTGCGGYEWRPYSPR